MSREVTAVMRSGPVAIEVRTERAAPRRLAAIRATATRQQLGADIIRLLDMIWPALRGQGARTGHNVVVHRDGGHGTLIVDVGVEVPGDLTEQGEMRCVQTPPGEVATAAHFGDCAQLAPAYAALENWLASNGRQPAGVSWEGYGDPAGDPAQTRTDIYFLLEPAAG